MAALCFLGGKASCVRLDRDYCMHASWPLAAGRNLSEGLNDAGWENPSLEVGLSSARVMVADAKGGWKLGTGIEFTAQVESYDLQF